MIVTPRGAFAIAADEALVPARYLDDAGVETWGIGHTAKAGDPDPATMAMAMPTNIDAVMREAWSVFLRDLDIYAREVRAIFGPMAAHECDGWTMWHYNTGGAHSSRAVGLWRAGDKAGAVRVLGSWNKITRRGLKQVSQALVDRRAREAAIILRGDYPEARLAVYPTDGARRVIWRPLATYTRAEWQAFIDPAPLRRADIWARLRTRFGAAFGGGR